MWLLVKGRAMWTAETKYIIVKRPHIQFGFYRLGDWRPTLSFPADGQRDYYPTRFTKGVN